MKKRWLMVMTLLLVAALGAMVYAETVEAPQWFFDMIEWRQDRIEEALNEGLITEEQAAWQMERLEAMEAYHLENGFHRFGGSACQGGGRMRSGGFQNGAGKMGGWFRGEQPSIQTQ
ncbi:hypothetical protein [Anoxynatronum sibiricum]|uniref:DUF2680 domain-containing protein n=1 Tax=Anoxynatronum sibiricum TaxID=210623 RepID=A0ABU9VRY6_9CLOT